MSDTSNYNTPVVKPKTPEEIKDDLTVLEAKNDFNRTNIFKWFVLVLSILLISCVVGCFIYKFFTDMKLQKFILDQIINNIIFIGLSALAILKISIPDIRK